MGKTRSTQSIHAGDSAIGHPESLPALLSKHRVRIERFIATRSSSKVRHVTTIDDLYQETMAIALAGSGTFEFRSDAEFINWVFTLARRTIFRAAARTDRLPHVERIRGHLSTGVGIAEDAMPGSERTPSSIASQGERKSRLHERINQLPEPMRRVLTLCRLEGRSLSEAAAETGYTWAYTAKLVSQAMKALRAQFEGTSCRPTD